jgi:hypothetical protein
MSATRVFSLSFAAAMLFAIAPHAVAQDAAYDPPDRVARLSYQSGDVEFAPAGDDHWGSANRNRPLGTGDRLTTGEDGRAALELGDASVRFDANSAVNLLDLDSQVAQFELSQGALNLRVRAFDPGQTYEVDTPTVAFVASQTGSYRIDVAPDGDSTMITVFTGAGTVYGEGGVSRAVVAGRSYRFDDSQLASVSVNRLPRGDAFDRFCLDRDARYDRSISRRYVSADVIGYDDLDGYGDWRASPEYGEVWYPNDVSSGWAPYRYGQWEWIDPWGWTWVDDRPWGFAPSHYGRWAYIDYRWGWIPGRPSDRAMYAPALVVFIGALAFGGEQPIGWFPLGPRDVYQPWYPVSRNYFTSINITNVRVINQTIVNNYYNTYVVNKTAVNPASYANRGVAGAVTVVPRNVFTGARPVAAAAMRIPPQTLAQAKVTPMLRVAPSAASLGVASANRPARMSTQLFARPVIARHAPPAPPAPAADRLKAISNQGGAPLAQSQLRDLRQAHANEQQAPRRVVLAAPGGGAMHVSQGEQGGRPAPRAPLNGGQNPTNANAAPVVNPANPQPPRQNNPQPDQQRDRGFVHAPRTDAQAPRAQDAQERPAPTPRPEPRAIPRDQTQQTDAQDRPQRPQPRVMQQQQQQPQQQQQQQQPRPEPRERPVVAPREQAQPQPTPRPEPRAIPRDQTQQTDVQDRPQRPEPRVMQQQQQQPRPEPRERPAVAPRQQAQPQPQPVQQPAQAPQETRKPKNKDEQKDKDVQDQQH